MRGDFVQALTEWDSKKPKLIDSATVVSVNGNAALFRSSNASAQRKCIVPDNITPTAGDTCIVMRISPQDPWVMIASYGQKRGQSVLGGKVFGGHRSDYTTHALATAGTFYRIESIPIVSSANTGIATLNALVDPAAATMTEFVFQFYLSSRLIASIFDYSDHMRNAAISVPVSGIAGSHQFHLDVRANQLGAEVHVKELSVAEL